MNCTAVTYRRPAYLLTIAHPQTIVQCWLLEVKELALVGYPIGYIAAAFGIPFALILLSAIAEKLVKGPPWRWKYFYLGVDLTLAAMSAALTNLADAELSGRKSLPSGADLKSALFLTGSLILLFILMSLKQDYGHADSPNRMQIFVMAFASNILATAVLFGFILMKLEGLL